MGWRCCGRTVHGPRTLFHPAVVGRASRPHTQHAETGREFLTEETAFGPRAQWSRLKLRRHND